MPFTGCHTLHDLGEIYFRFQRHFCSVPPSIAVATSDSDVVGAVASTVALRLQVLGCTCPRLSRMKREACSLVQARWASSNTTTRSVGASAVATNSSRIRVCTCLENGLFEGWSKEAALCQEQSSAEFIVNGS